MSIALVVFGRILFCDDIVCLQIVCLDGGGCLFVTHFFQCCHIGTVAFVFRNNAPNSASAANDITALIIVDMFRAVPLFGGNAASSDR